MILSVVEVAAWGGARGSVVVIAPEAFAAPPVEAQTGAYAAKDQVYNDHASFGPLSPFELKAAAPI